MRFLPQADLALLDPIHSVTFVTRNHALMVFDTLYGWDAELRAWPQKPFPLLPDALAKMGTHVCAIMSERFAELPSSKAVPKLIGSGPFRYLAAERIAGSRNVYAKPANGGNCRPSTSCRSSGAPAG